MTKNLCTHSFSIEQFQGNSDHKPIHISIDFKSKLEKRVLSKVNRKFLQQHVAKYMETLNSQFQIAKQENDIIDTATLYDNVSQEM